MKPLLQGTSTVNKSSCRYLQRKNEINIRFCKKTNKEKKYMRLFLILLSGNHAILSRLGLVLNVLFIYQVGFHDGQRQLMLIM